MQLSILISTVLATLAYSMPTRREQVHSETFARRADFAGTAYLDFDTPEKRGELYVNGACTSLYMMEYSADAVNINPNIRCRYFR